MPSINYSPAQTQQIDDLRSYINEYCQTNGIDPQVYTQYLDGQKNLNAEVLNDPAFQAYWKLAYLQLMEIMNPSLIQSMLAETGEVDFDEVQARAGNELNEFIKNLVIDNPEFMSFAALADGDSQTSPEAFRQLIEEHMAEQAREGEYIDEESRRLKEELGLNGSWDWLIGTEEGIRTAENRLMKELAEMDFQLLQLNEALSHGTITIEEYQAKMGTHSQTRNFHLSLIQNLESMMKQIMEMFSQLIKSQQESAMAVIRNVGGGA